MWCISFSLIQNSLSPSSFITFRFHSLRFWMAAGNFTLKRWMRRQSRNGKGRQCIVNLFRNRFNAWTDRWIVRTFFLVNEVHTHSMQLRYIYCEETVQSSCLPLTGVHYTRRRGQDLGIEWISQGEYVVWEKRGQEWRLPWKRRRRRRRRERTSWRRWVGDSGFGSLFRDRKCSQTEPKCTPHETSWQSLAYGLVWVRCLIRGVRVVSMQVLHLKRWMLRCRLFLSLTVVVVDEVLFIRVFSYSLLVHLY